MYTHEDPILRLRKHKVHHRRQYSQPTIRYNFKEEQYLARTVIHSTLTAHADSILTTYETPKLLKNHNPTYEYTIHDTNMHNQTHSHRTTLAHTRT